MRFIIGLGFTHHIILFTSYILDCLLSGILDYWNFFALILESSWFLSSFTLCPASKDSTEMFSLSFYWGWKWVLWDIVLFWLQKHLQQKSWRLYQNLRFIFSFLIIYTYITDVLQLNLASFSFVWLCWTSCPLYFGLS